MKSSKPFGALLLAFAILASAFTCINPFVARNASLGNPIEAPSVEIRLTSDGQVAALVKGDPAFPATVFLLQTTNSPSLSGSITIRKSTVQYSSDCVVFRSTDSGQNVVFKLGGASCPTPVGNLGVYTGYGLTKQKDEALYNAFVATGTGTFPPVAEFSCKCHQIGIPPECDSGGDGATHCATGSSVATVSTQCEVTCGGGYYACCNE